MIVYLLLKGILSLLFALISIIPSFDTPAWVSSSLPGVLTTIASFNHYLPVSETVGVVLFIISFTLIYKLIKVGLNVVNIDLNK